MTIDIPEPDGFLDVLSCIDSTIRDLQISLRSLHDVLELFPPELHVIENLNAVRYALRDYEDEFLNVCSSGVRYAMDRETGEIIARPKKKLE